MFTNSFIKDSEPTILTSHDKTNEKLSSNMMVILYYIINKLCFINMIIIIHSRA